MSRSSKITLVILGLLLLLAGAITWYVLSQNQTPSVAETAFRTNGEVDTYIGMDGRSVDVASLLENGQPMVVTTWASWCPECAKQLERLEAVAAEHTGEILFLAVNRSETKIRAERYLMQLPELPHVEIIIDQEDHFYDIVEGYAMPETVVFNQVGDVVHQQRGLVDSARLRDVLQSLQ